jgi:hypothetical protein
MARRVLIVSFSPIASDPRVMRQVRALQALDHLTVLGFGRSPPEVTDFVAIEAVGSRIWEKATRAALLLLRQFDTAYWRWKPAAMARKALKGRTFDVVIANDILAVPVALEAAGGSPVIFDGHEYSPREFEDSALWRLFFGAYLTHLCSKFLPRTAASMVVCESIGKEYQALCGISPEVVMNSPPLQALLPRPVEAARVRMVHHGIAGRSRSLERMIDVMDLLDARFELDFMLVNTDSAYMEELKDRASKNPRIRFRDPVPMDAISATINEYDIGIFLLPPNNLNYQYALPNKFFEFIQARLAVAIGPSPEMALVLRQWKFGVVARDFEPTSLADELRKLDARSIEQMKAQADKAAHVLHAGVVEKQVRGLLDSVLGQA